MSICLMMKALGYTGSGVNGDGICHGIAVTAAISYCTENKINENFLSMMHKIQNIDKKMLPNVFKYLALFNQEKAPFHIDPCLNEICVYSQGKVLDKFFVTYFMDRANRKDHAIATDVLKFVNLFKKEEWVDVKAFFDTFCIFMGCGALPENFSKENCIQRSQFKLMDHFSMLMGYRSHEITSSIEALFNEEDLVFVINKLIEDNDKKVFAMVIALFDHTVCLGWDGMGWGKTWII